jgi:predicted nucleic acid-binding protein
LSAVVDSSVLIAALIDSGADGNWAEEILSASALHAPELARVETTNILRRLELAGRISTSQASAAFEDFMQLAIVLYPFEPFVSGRSGIA